MKKVSFIQKMLVFFSLYLININVQAQTTLNSIPELKVETTNLPVKTISVSGNNENINSTNSTTGNEAIPTPEQQGFDKMTINGKTVYIKKVDDIIIEYKPE